jgi:hypothetical protein
MSSIQHLRGMSSRKGFFSPHLHSADEALLSPTFEKLLGTAQDDLEYALQY